MTGGGDEDRIIDELGLAGGDLGQHRPHVGVGWGHGLLGGDGAAELLEGLGKYRLQPVGVGAAVVDRGGLLGSKLLEGKFGGDGTLDLVVVGRAQVAIVFRPALRIGQDRSRIRGRNGGDARLPQDRDAGSRLARAVGANGRNDARIGGQLGRCRLAALGVAAGVLAAQLNGIAQQFAAFILNGNFDAAFGIRAERCIRSGDHHPVGDVDRLAFFNGDDPQRILRRSGLSGAHQREPKYQKQRDQKSKTTVHDSLLCRRVGLG